MILTYDCEADLCLLLHLIYLLYSFDQEQIHQRRSALHDAASLATIGYVGVSTKTLGIPFLSIDTFYRNPSLWRVKNPLGAAIYGALGLGLGMFSGKPI